jgi:hypothetical protein
MDYTYNDYFNYYLKEFLNELINNFPDTKVNVLANYRNLLEGRDDKNDVYAKYFMTKINNHLISLAKKDDTLFSKENLVFIEGVDFHQVWNNSSTTEQNQKAIWKYLQMLMLIGRKIIPDHKEIVEMLKKVGNEVSVPAKVEKTLTELSEEEKEEEKKSQSSGFDMGNLLNMASGLKGMTGGGDGGLDIGGLFKNLSEGLGDLNLGEMPDFTAGDDVGESGEGENEGSNDGETSGNNENGPNIANSGLFADLAKEMTDTFDFEAMEKDGEAPQNVGDALGKFMSGDNPAKLMSMVSKFGARLQNDISSGKVNQNDLMKETMQMMGNLQKGAKNPDLLRQQAEQMMGNNPELKARMRQMSGQNVSKSESTATKDRLRAKLDAKRAKSD